MQAGFSKRLPVDAPEALEPDEKTFAGTKGEGTDTVNTVRRKPSPLQARFLGGSRGIPLRHPYPPQKKSNSGRHTMHSAVTFTVFAAAGLCGFLPAAGAQAPGYRDDISETAPSELSPCIGYDPQLHTWGPKSPGTGNQGLCPVGSAVFGTVATLSREERKGPSTPLHLFCCPLPDGVLTSETTIVSSDCPEEFVITGERLLDPTTEPGGIVFQCTRVNTARFTLAAARAGARMRLTDSLFDYFGNTFRGELHDSEAVLSWEALPVGIRYGVGRMNRLTWVRTGCVGNPPGSLLSGRSGEDCSSLTFREVRLKDNDREAPMYPHCRAIDAPLSPAARCIP